MQNNLQVFDYNGAEIRTVIIKGEPWFVAKDLGDILGLSNIRVEVSRLDDDEKRVSQIVTPSNGGYSNVTVISESGLYQLILRSNKPEAKLFSKWVRSEVLPSIRKHGAYMTPETIEKTLSDPDFIIRLATDLKNERAKRQALEIKIEEDKPKVIFADSVANSESLMPIGNLATILKQNGINTGRTRLFEWLRCNGYLQRASNSERNTPTQKAMEMGLLQLVEHVIDTGYGDSILRYTPKVTPKGQQYFINLFLDHPEFLEE